MINKGVFCCCLLLLAATSDAATSNWWDNSYPYRQNITVNTGSNTPFNGYQNYTVRANNFDTQTLITNGQMRSDCADLRVLFFNGTGYQELPRHIINCNSTNTDIRFALQANIGASASDDNYYLYYGNLSATGPVAMTPTNVYLWFDDAQSNRSANYLRGRIDAWHGSGWDNSLAWNPAGYYSYNNGDNFTSGYRRAVNERDVYLEAEFFHTGCYPLNMTTGLLSRGIISSGSNGSESSDHYYASNRGHNANCGSGYNHDGAIIEDQRTNTVALPTPNPPAIVNNQWRKQGFASWLTSPSQLAFWDEDNANDWAALGWPSAGNLLLSANDNATENTGAGFAAIMTAQDQARFRNFLIRRYVEPEPSLSLTPELQADISVTKSDPVDSYSPGQSSVYTIIVRNDGPSPAINTSVSDPLLAGTSVSWTCSANANSSCISGDPLGTGSSGSGAIAENLDLLANGVVTYTVTVTYSSNPGDY